jgi:hypothetical protein
MDVVKGTNLLLLRGIYQKDLDEIATPEVLPEPVMMYTETPARFTSKETWPTHSNRRCWECNLVPPGYPRFIPLNPEKIKDEDVCDAYGHFCEWNCAVRYTMRELPREQQWDILRLICLFESKFSGRRREKIMPAPSRVLMKQYCGNGGLTPKQFREQIAKINADYDISGFGLTALRPTASQ